MHVAQMFMCFSSLVDFATRECGPRGWLRAAIQDCASFDFMNAREEVKRITLLYIVLATAYIHMGVVSYVAS